MIYGVKALLQILSVFFLKLILIFEKESFVRQEEKLLKSGTTRIARKERKLFPKIFSPTFRSFLHLIFIIWRKSLSSLDFLHHHAFDNFHSFPLFYKGERERARGRKWSQALHMRNHKGNIGRWWRSWAMLGRVEKGFTFNKKRFYLQHSLWLSEILFFGSHLNEFLKDMSSEVKVSLSTL